MSLKRGKITAFPVRVVSIDVGLRNMGFAVVETSAALIRPWPRTEPEHFQTFCRETVQVLCAENIDLLDENQCKAKNAKSVGMLRHAAFWDACMRTRKRWFLDPVPDVVVVEVQDAHNGAMRALAGAIVGTLLGRYRGWNVDPPVTPCIDMVRGDRKLMVCDLLGWTWTSTSKLTYEQRKKKACEGLALLRRQCPRNPVLAECMKYPAKKRRDVADAVLQGIWILWSRVQLSTKR